MAYGMASFESFHPVVASAKLASAGLVLAAIGRAMGRHLDLAREGPLLIARDVLLGQATALAWVYMRSLLCDVLGLPGITSIEAFLLVAILLAAVLNVVSWAGCCRCSAPLPGSVCLSARSVCRCCHSLWNTVPSASLSTRVGLCLHKEGGWWSITAWSSVGVQSAALEVCVAVARC